MMDTEDPKMGQHFTIDSLLLLAAASDTTATAINATFFYPLPNPSALARVTTGVCMVFTNAEETDMASPALTPANVSRPAST